MKVFAASLLGLAGVLALGFIFTSYDVGMYKFWEPHVLVSPWPLASVDSYQK